MIDWKNLRAIVEEASELPAPERDAFLDTACSGDAALRREAGDLVAAALRDEHYLDPPDFTRAAEPVLDLETRIGAYRLVRPIGSGGMGTVYEAERMDPQRRVALKVMRGGLTSAASAARFRYEVEVLAALEHPHIARMYDTGIHVEASNGRRELPWFAMEYVEDARPLVRYARNEALSIAARVRLFAAVCDAVHHGHAKGVLHRDLKPDNLLVDRRGRPKVIDFGVARATDADLTRGTQHTRLGEIVGTLAYMSPEQIAGDRAAIDVRSDVYALGVVLYELLTGARPHDLGDVNLVEAARLIQEAPPRRPSAVETKVRGDLETIVLKCLAKEPDRRYASATALAQDLRRYLASEPVEAHPPSLTYQVRMFARRNRALVAAAGLVVALSLAAAGVSLAALARVQRSERAARAETAKARTLFETLLERAVSTSREFAPRLKHAAGGAAVMREMIQADLADLAVLEEMAPDDPEVRRQLAVALLNLGEVLGDPTAANQLGDRAGCRASYERALAIAADLHEADPVRPELMRLLARALTQCGKLASLAKDFEVAEARLRDALELREAHHALKPHSLDALDGLVATVGRLAEHVARQKDDERFLRLRERQHALAEDMLARWPDRREAQWRHASTLSLVAAMHLEGRDFAAAGEAYDAAVAGFEDLAAADPENVLYRVELADALMHGGLTQRHLKHYDDADAMTQRALRLFEALRGEDPDNRRIVLMLGMAHKEVGAVSEARAGVEGLAADERRALLEAARDQYRTAWEHYVELERGGAGHMSTWMRGFHDRAVEALARAK